MTSFVSKCKKKTNFIRFQSNKSNQTKIIYLTSLLIPIAIIFWKSHIMSLSSSLFARRTLSRICNGETLLMTYDDIFSSHMNFGVANMGKRYEKNIYLTRIILRQM